MNYVILSPKHSTKDQACFWRADDAGYTYFPFNAGIYTEEQIKEKPHYYNNGISAIAIPMTNEAMHAIKFKCTVDCRAAERFLNRKSF